MLEIKDLQFSYGKKENVLNNLNLNLEAGQIGIILGKKHARIWDGDQNCVS